MLIRGRAFLGWSALTVVVAALGLAAIRLAPADTNVSAWWPAAGIAVAAALRVGPRGVPWAGAATFVGSIVANLVGGRDADVAVLFALANTTEVLVTCWLLRRWNRSGSESSAGAHAIDLHSIGALTRAGAAATVGAMLAGLVVGLTVVGLLDGSYWVAARAVWASHLAAVLVFLPFALAGPQRRHQAGRAEQVTTAVVLVGAALVVFRPEQHLPLVFVLFPLLVLMAFRQSLQMCAAHLILVNVAVTAASSAGWGPIVEAVRRDGLEPETSGTIIEILILSTAVMVYALRITVESRQESADAEVRARRHLRAVIESAHTTAIIETDLDGVINVFNQGAVNLTGYAEAQVVGRHTPLLFHDPEELEARARDLGIDPGIKVFTHDVQGPLRSGERRDWTYVGPDGRRRTVSLVVSRVEDTDGATVGYLGIAEDVGAQRRVEALLLQALEQERSLAERLRDADALKADFVSSVSHELRTPMTSVLGYAEILADLHGDALGEDGSEIVGRIEASGHRLLALVDGLLTLSRLDSDTPDAPTEPVDVVRAARSAVAVLQPLATAGDLEVVLDAPDRPQPVLGDPAAIERVVLNLLSNAIKFTGDGGRIRIRVDATDPESVLLTVTDTGVGIPPGELQHVFDRFHRATNVVRSAAPGTGLGLAIVRSIVEQHGGTVEVASRLGAGTTFSVRLPRHVGISVT